jgi:cytochrome c peroxidase
LVALLGAALAHCAPRPAPARVAGVNPDPVQLVHPTVVPLTPVALLGRLIFVDRNLSGSRTISCASCHNPAHAFGPPDALAAQPGGPAGLSQGVRAVPSLRYADRIPNFSIGPDNGENEGVNVVKLARQTVGEARPVKAAGSVGGGAPMVPRGGLFWDGRANTLQTQALGPLFNPVEMANSGVRSVADRLRGAPYGGEFVRLFGEAAVATPERLVDEAMFAVARYQVEDAAFHPYTSKYDAWLEGKAVLAPDEARGLALFEDPRKGNCAACHVSRPGPDHAPPLFTDFQYEALGVPRNQDLRQNADPRYYDLGLCGPVRTDLRTQTQYCGMFQTPSLRNVATRQVFFHNGRYHALLDVIRFYNLRAVYPDSVYPRDSRGGVLLFDDLPPMARGNVDTTDAPFNGRPGGVPLMTARDMQDVIAFLKTLTDGYRPGKGEAGESR